MTKKKECSNNKFVVDLFLDDGTMGGRTRSLDSLEPDDDEEREIPIKKKKHRSFEESDDASKKSEKVKRRQHVEKDSSEGESVKIGIRNFGAMKLKCELSFMWV